MKRLLYAFIFIGLVSVAYGATTCLHTGTVMFVLQKSAEPTSASYDAENNTFQLNFNYELNPGNSSIRTLKGEATCNEIDTNTDGGAITRGGANTHLRASTGDEGTRCWCSLAWPITSWWVFLQTYVDNDTCRTSCARDCMTAIRDNTNGFRGNGVYQAIW